jgi:mannose-6-phosphate isomerase-like protein (cupin superfamily)
MPPNATERPLRYHTFLLSLWEEAGGGSGWRFSLENPHTGERIGFRSPDELARYLRDWTGHTTRETHMSTEQQPTAVLLAPGGGRIFNVLGVLLTIKTGGADSGGQWFVIEYTAPPNLSGPPPHLHKVMTELFYVIEGALTLRVGEQTLEVGAGGYAYVPPGTVHGFSNQTSAPTRFLGIASPAILEQYFVEMRELVKNEPQWPPQDMGKILALMTQYDTFPVSSPE